MNQFPMLTDKDLKCTEIPEILGSGDILKRIRCDYCLKPQQRALMNLQFVSKKKKKGEKHKRKHTRKAFLLFSNRVPEATEVFSKC